jgi:3-oxoacyl-[acyl-carrier-protein] synthase I
MTVSTACSSSAKVFAQAARSIATGLVDAALVGGVDSLASSTLFGFHALGLVSSQPCRPFDRRRDGISIGEAGGFALLERVDANPHALRLVGTGESSDAHHMSSPHPEGLGARLAIDAALSAAGLDAAAVDYINLHGTATPKNDTVEATLVATMFPPSTHAGSTKGWTGHTLGAAGIVEAVVSMIALRDSLAPGTLNADQRDAACGPQIRFDNANRAVDVALSHAFAFGGNNCVLAFAQGR